MKRLSIPLVLAALSGCTSVSHYVVASQFVASSQGQQPPEVIETEAYRVDGARTTTVAVRAPDSCANATADQASGGAQSQGAILATTCGVEMGDIERAFARANYKVISWKVLAREMAGNKSATEVAQALGAEVLFQINSLEKSQKTLGKDARWERRYYRSDANGARLGDQPLPDDQRDLIARTYLTRLEGQYNPRTYAVTLDASAVWVKSGQSIWYYRWTKAAEPPESGSSYSLHLNCKDNVLATCIATRQAEQERARSGGGSSQARSGEVVGVSVSEKAEDRERAVQAELLKEVIDNFVQRFSAARSFAPGS
ncbi:hypothetical protein [Inhella sp.]|uniref:hypothetical protein n=1 Tax=Inhella sp. TaxID=1921806 RepID=UPI0035AE0B9B